jgi:hypothetical protein
LKPFKYLVLTTLFLGLIASPVKAEVSLSFDELGQGAFTKSGSQFAGMGDSAFLDWRPLQFISFGVGGQFTYLFQSPSLRWLDTFDVGGRLFPFSASSTGEFYLQGGVGLNLLDTPGKYHGFAGFGWRQFLNSDVAMDMGVQYDFFSPLDNPINAIAGKVGLTFLFGKNDWSLSAQAGNNGPTTIVLGTNWKGESYYIWKDGDNVQALAYAAYGDAGLYTLILDANKDLMYRDGFSPGDKLRIPAMPKMKIEVNPGTNKNGSPHNPLVHSYFWRSGDKLPDVAQKLYGDPDMYPLLIDGIETGLMDPSDLVSGKMIEVPSFTPGDVDEVHKKAKDPGYIWWRDSVGAK